MIRNFKRVEMGEVKFASDGLTVLGGQNLQGKSTFLDAVSYLLGGKKYAPSNPHNVNAGGATALLRAKLSNGIEVERSGKNGALKVHVDGEKGNQATLKDFLNEFALDLGKFLHASDADKSKMLIQHLGIGEKLDHLDAKIKSLYDERTVTNRDAERKKQLADGLPTYDDAPTKKVRVGDVVEQRTNLAEENADRQRKADRMGALKERGIHLNERIAELEKLLTDAKAEKEKVKAEYMECKQAVEAHQEHDLTALDEQIKNAESLNMMVDANARAKQAKEEADATAQEAQKLTDSINESREQRAKLIDEIEMPIEGLSVVDGELQFNGQRWDGMSGSERLRVATAMARAFRPECGFVLVDRLEEMDWQTLSEFNEWAKASGIQIIGAMVCDVDKGGENVIIIEDGRVKS